MELKLWKEVFGEILKEYLRQNPNKNEKDVLVIEIMEWLNKIIP